MCVSFLGKDDNTFNAKQSSITKSEILTFRNIHNWSQMNRGVDSWGYCEGTHFCDIKSYMKSHFFIAEGEVGSDVFFIWTVLMDHLFLTILDLYFSIQLYLYVKIIVNKVFFISNLKGTFSE